MLFKRTLITLVCGLFLVACGTEKEGNAELKEDLEAPSQQIIRKKIEKLDPKAFVEITIDLTKEKSKWEADWIEFMKKKREEYFNAWGLTEKQFQDFPANNSQAIQQYLLENPQASQAYIEANQAYSRQGP